MLALSYLKHIIIEVIIKYESTLLIKIGHHAQKKVSMRVAYNFVAESRT